MMWICFTASFIVSAITWFTPACRKNYLPGKMVNSALFVATAVFAALAKDGSPRFDLLIITGLIFGLIGDFFLEWKQSKYFYAGVAAFTVNHGFYLYAFLTQFSTDLQPYFKYTLIGAAAVIVAGIIDMKFESIKFHGFENIMFAYSAVLIASFLTAATRGTVSISVDGNTALGLCLILGGSFFIVSDTFLAAQLYGKSHFKHPEAFVLFFYFPAQTLFALSVYYFA